MKRYIALLRGINVSGKNKIAMSELKRGFEELNFLNVVTYLNSGNVIFSCTNVETDLLSSNIQKMIKGKFNLEIPVFIITQEKLKEILEFAPKWWGNESKEIYDNLIFLISPFTYQQLYDTIGSPKEEYETISNYDNAIFWSFDRINYQKTNWWSKTADSSVGSKITIRTANTVRKIVNM